MQESEEMKSNSLGVQLKKTEAELHQQEKQMNDQMRVRLRVPKDGGSGGSKRCVLYVDVGVLLITGAWGCSTCVCISLGFMDVWASSDVQSSPRDVYVRTPHCVHVCVCMCVCTCHSLFVHTCVCTYVRTCVID